MPRASTATLAALFIASQALGEQHLHNWKNSTEFRATPELPYDVSATFEYCPKERGIVVLEFEARFSTDEGATMILYKDPTPHTDGDESTFIYEGKGNFCLYPNDMSLTKACPGCNFSQTPEIYTCSEEKLKERDAVVEIFFRHALDTLIPQPSRPKAKPPLSPNS